MVEITSTHEMEEAAWDGENEPGEVQSSLTATTEPVGGIEFFVQMRDYTKRDMEDLIVEAAAQQIVGSRNQRTMAKAIEDRCAELVSEKIDKHLCGVTAEIIDKPLMPKFPGMKNDTPVTMREFIGLAGREYLDARVDRHTGKPTTDNYSAVPRLQYLVTCHIDRTFKDEIEKATRFAIGELQREIKARHEETLANEKKRLRDALDKTL